MAGMGYRPGVKVVGGLWGAGWKVVCWLWVWGGRWFVGFGCGMEGGMLALRCGMVRAGLREYFNYLNMAQRADGESLSKFLQDRELLPYNDAEIARGMVMDRSNFSSYVNGHLPITKSFLRRFYSAFGEELGGIREKRKGELEERDYDRRLGAVEERLNWLIGEFMKIRGEGVK